MHTETSIKRKFAHLKLGAEAQTYLDYNAKRYACLLGVVEGLRRQIPAPTIRVMDIGPSFFTELLRSSFPGDQLLTLGLCAAETRGGHLPEGIALDMAAFHEFNLNDSQDPAKWIAVPPCEIVVMAEVLEHLYTAPTLVLRFVSSFLSPGGYLVVTVPNAAAIIKRLLLLFGKHPYEMIRENAANPGHYREYTLKEIYRIAASCGLSVCSVKALNYAYPMELEKYNTPKGRLMRLLSDYAPPNMRNNFVAILQKPR